MRALRSLLLLALALALLHHFTAGAPLAARATLALGLVVLLAELAGRLAARWGVPRVAAFVATGLLSTPALVGLVRPDEVQALAFVGDAALALFVVRAGLSAGARRAGPIAAGAGQYLTASIIVPLVTTAAAVYGLHQWFPLTVHQPLGDALAVAVTVGVLTVVAAPALTWATQHDAPAGPLSDAILRLHAMREFVAVLLFAGALALARVFASPGALEPRVFLLPLEVAGGAILAGVLLAWLASQYRRLLDGDPGVFLVALAFGAAVAAWTGRAEVTLVGLVAGLVLPRLDHDGAERLAAHFDARGAGLGTATFALVGLGLDASVLVELWLWVLVVVVARAIGLAIADRVSANPAGVPGALAGRGWLGLVSQGGLGISLAAVGRRAFPEWGVSFEGFVVGVVAIHAVIGPVCLRWALGRPPQPLQGASGGM
jgi:Kef-type K+ transport system membrane component KefB